MTWKTTILWSGASVLAAWLGVATGTPASRQASAPAPRAERRPAAAGDIQAEASRLQSRLRSTREYVAPTRDPFRFGATRVSPQSRLSVPAAPALPPEPPAPVAPPFTLAGIGGTEGSGTMAYTAVLSTPAGVVLARPGDQVAGGWRVDAVDENSVTVIAADGRTERLALPK